MQILSHLNQIAGKINSPYVVIGGHAVTAHGFSRSTGDLDLVIRRSSKEDWYSELSRIGYLIFNETSAFAQFKPNRLDAWPIDLMLVDDGTFQQLLDKSVGFKFNEVEAPIASTQHLIAMKLHALKRRPKHRERKDLDDLDNLLRIQGTPASDEQFRQLCLKYDSIWVYEELNQKL